LDYSPQSNHRSNRLDYRRRRWLSIGARTYHWRSPYTSLGTVALTKGTTKWQMNLSACDNLSVQPVSGQQMILLLVMVRLPLSGMHLAL
jgi:hypothetical protein